MGDLGTSPKQSAKSELARLALLTAEAIARRQATGVKAPNETTREEHFALEVEEVIIIEGSHNLDFHASKVTQKQLDTLHTCF